MVELSDAEKGALDTAIFFRKQVLDNDLEWCEDAVIREALDDLISAENKLRAAGTLP
jgi:hypothetical protein